VAGEVKLSLAIEKARTYSGQDSLEIGEWGPLGEAFTRYRSEKGNRISKGLL